MSAASGEKHAEGKNRIARSLDALMDGGGLQALLARWKWIPQFDTVDGYEITPYEAACGAKPRATNYMGKDWCTRFLRGIGEQVWLGPELLGRVGELAAIESFASVERTGSAIRIAAHDGVSLDSIESALERILPGAADFNRTA